MEEMDPSLLDRYILGELSKDEERRIEAMTVADPDLMQRVEGLRAAMASLSWQGQVAPPAGLKEKVLSAMNRTVRVEQESGRPPILHEGSSLDEFAPWLENPEHVLPAEKEDFHMVELDMSGDRQTGLVWLKHGHPVEVHSDCVERIMILEGACTIQIGKEHVSLSPGDVFAIPMHVEHSVHVTSACWCKALVQRVAA